MSRAKRLSNKVDENTGSNRTLLLGIPVVLAGLGAAAFMGSKPTDTIEPVIEETAAVEVPTVASEDTAVINDILEPSPRPTPAPLTTTASAVPSVFGGIDASPTVSQTPDCIPIIETKIATIKSSLSANTSVVWENYQGDVTGLVQEVINCPDAKFELTGSLELLGLGLADLEINWDKNAYELTLTTVTTTPDVPDQGITKTDNTINFTLR